MKQLFILIGLSCLTLMSFSPRKGNCPYTFQTDRKIIYDICFTRNGGAIGITDGNVIKLYSTCTKEIIGCFDNGHNKQVLSIDISDDSLLLVSGGRDSLLILWDLINQKQLRSLRYEGIITTVSFSPDNRYIAIGGSADKVFVYDINKHEVLYIFSDHTNDITSVSFSPDGRYLATSGGDKLIYIYSVQNGEMLTILTGHTNWVRSISFSLDGTRLISCGDDSRVILWKISDMKNPTIIEKSKEGFHWLLSADINEDNRTIAFGDLKGSVVIITRFLKYKMKIKYPVNRILFKPEEKINLIVAVATSGKGVMLIDAQHIKL